MSDHKQNHEFTIPKGSVVIIPFDIVKINDPALKMELVKILHDAVREIRTFKRS